jgi:hypothetical protein
VLPLVAIGLVATPVSAAAPPPKVPLVEGWAITPNLTPLSFSERSVPTLAGRRRAGGRPLRLTGPACAV